MEPSSTVNIMHNDEGIILQIPTGQNTYTIIGLSDQIIEQVYEERKKRKQDKIKIIKPGVLSLRD